MAFELKIGKRRFPLWNPRRSWKGYLVFFAVAGFIYLYGRPLAALYLARSLTGGRPELGLRPTPLPDARYEKTGGTALSYFGYEFEAPWTEIVIDRAGEFMTAIEFSGGGEVVVFNPIHNVNVLEAMNGGAGRAGVDVASVFGADVAVSNFALETAILNVTPADLRLRFSRRQMVRDSIFLPLKTLAGVTSATGHGLYSFQTGWVKGFQFGSPEIDRYVVIHGFGDDDAHVEMSIGYDPASQKKLSQAEVNRIIHSLRPATRPGSERYPPAPEG